ncbi:glycoside hydrolase domain-containing protein [Acetobacterium carbinolicum]|uniref:glycoside hydrolase domain-containing protein n=1 Tax=Acetobacterium carbinolicum TaxID=52690 RepID=UPI0039C9CEC5
MDQKVLMTQVWLNNTYAGQNGYIDCDEDGATGNGTIASLISALQIEIGIVGPTGEFGPATAAACPTLQSGAMGNGVKILQGALWCKGFSSADLTGTFDSETISGVNQFQSEAGFIANSMVTPKIFKGILSTDAVVLISNGDPRIREIQKNLNKKYSDYFWKDLNIVPCDGVYGRNTCNALLYAFQAAEGITEPNGVFGPMTENLTPLISRWSDKTEFVLLLQYLLYVNGFDPGDFDGGFGYGVENKVMAFQEMMALDTDGIVGLSTWAALLVSKGNVNRSANAVDTTYRISPARASYLKDTGINYVGRYLSGYWPVTLTELDSILAAGLHFIPIFERSGSDENAEYVTEIGYFTSVQGTKDALYAIEKADRLGLPRATIIYFAVDFDVYDYEVESNIIPYFSALKTALSQNSDYQAGIYASRSACKKVANAGHTVASYVCDMSTGFSGNIGHTIPSNWAFDQYAEVTVGQGWMAMDVDKVIASGRDNGVDAVTVANLPRVLCEYTMESLHLTPTLGWANDVTYTFTTLAADIEYKMGISGEFTPIIDKDGLPSNNKATLLINNGRFDEVEFSSAQSIFDSMNASNKMIFGDSGTLQPVVSIANTVEHGSMTVAFKIDDTGNLQVDLQVEQDIHESSTDTETVYVEVCYTIKKNSDNSNELNQIEEGIAAIFGVVGLVVLVMVLLAETPIIVGGTAITGLLVLLGFVLNEE